MTLPEPSDAVNQSARGTRAPGASAFLPDNEVTLLVDGDETFAQGLAALEHARERIWLETYIFEPDPAGMRVLEALTEAAGRGVDVILVVDRVGSRQLRPRHLEPLRRAGGVVIRFNPFLGLRSRSSKVSALGIHRDHRKVFIIDEQVYCGGRNVSMEYGSTGEDTFYDVMVCIRGPAVRALGEVFLETLEDTSDVRRTLFPAPAPAGDIDVRVLQLDLRERVSALDDALLQLITSATREVLFSSPYFLPASDTLDALCETARRGVDVRVLTAGQSDVPVVTAAGRRNYERLIASGVRIFEMVSHPLHAKFFVADQARSIVGSYNADRWGQRFNQEVAVEILSGEVAERLAYCFAEGAEIEITAERVASWSRPRRVFYAALYGLSRVLAPDP